MQMVIRTRPKSKQYFHESGAYKNLISCLENGWHVVLVTPIGDELEYILENPAGKEK